MPISNCPDCDQTVDMDGFCEHGVPTLFYCECGRVYDVDVLTLIEVPKDKVDLSGLEGKWPVQEPHCGNRGLFILKSRLKDN